MGGCGRSDLSNNAKYSLQWPLLSGPSSSWGNLVFSLLEHTACKLHYALSCISPCIVGLLFSSFLFVHSQLGEGEGKGGRGHSALLRVYKTLIPATALPSILNRLAIGPYSEYQLYNSDPHFRFPLVDLA